MIYAKHKQTSPLFNKNTNTFVFHFKISFTLVTSKKSYQVKMVITRFRNEHFFLSNFYLCDIVLNGKVYPSAEHAFQAAKCVNIEDHERIRKATTPAIAKSIGRRVCLKPNWEEDKAVVMEWILREKFKNPQLRLLLQKTKNYELKEGNIWHDTYWGVCTCFAHDGEGKNVMGKILCLIRDSDVSHTK